MPERRQWGPRQNARRFVTSFGRRRTVLLVSIWFIVGAAALAALVIDLFGLGRPNSPSLVVAISTLAALTLFVVTRLFRVYISGQPFHESFRRRRTREAPPRTRWRTPRA
jgi:hypothetical protein